MKDQGPRESVPEGGVVDLRESDLEEKAGLMWILSDNTNMIPAKIECVKVPMKDPFARRIDENLIGFSSPDADKFAPAENIEDRTRQLHSAFPEKLFIGLNTSSTDSSHDQNNIHLEEIVDLQEATPGTKEDEETKSGHNMCNQNSFHELLTNVLHELTGRSVQMKKPRSHNKDKAVLPKKQESFVWSEHPEFVKSLSALRFLFKSK